MTTDYKLNIALSSTLEMNPLSVVLPLNLTNNIQTLMTNVQLKAAGVSPSSVRYVAIPFPDMEAALKAGRVDAISAVEPFLAGAESAGARQIVSDCAGATSGLPGGQR